MIHWLVAAGIQVMPISPDKINTHPLILLGNRLKALHINADIGTDVDLHLLPYEGNISWDQVMKALDEIDYHNDFSLSMPPSYPRCRSRTIVL